MSFPKYYSPFLRVAKEEKERPRLGVSPQERKYDFRPCLGSEGVDPTGSSPLMRRSGSLRSIT